MDSIYGSWNQFSSQVINISEYFKNYAKSCQLHRIPETDDVFELMNVNFSNEEKKLLEEYCSIDNLHVPGELSKIDENARKIPKNCLQNPANVELQTIRRLVQRKQLPKPTTVKYSNKEINIDHKKSDVNPVNVNLATPYKDIIIHVRVYEPFLDWKTQIVKRTASKPMLQSEIQVLGCQTLTELRDQIQCLSDLSISTEISENPNASPGKMAKDVYKSGFFYIEGTFYNDYRDPQNIDYSHDIINWAKSRHLGPFQTTCMEGIRIDSLNLRFGFPWVYQHQGSCEHLIIFSNARLIHSKDELQISAYPRIHKLTPHRIIRCTMCTDFPADWIIKENKRIPHDPAFFCNRCFRLYNYKDNKKIGNFKAYRFPYRIDVDEFTTESTKMKINNK